MTSFLLYYVSGNSERMIFNKNIIPNNGQAPFLIPGHEEKCLAVLGCYIDLGSFFENENGSRLYFFRPKSGKTNLSRR